MVFRTDSAASLELLQRSNPDPSNPWQNFLRGLVLSRTESHGRMRLMLGGWLRSQFASQERLKHQAAARHPAADGADEAQSNADQDSGEHWQPSQADHDYLRSMVGRVPQPQPRDPPRDADGKQREQSNTASDDSIEGTSDYSETGPSTAGSSSHALPDVSSTPSALAALSPGSQPSTPPRGASMPSTERSHSSGPSSAAERRVFAASMPVSPLAPASSPQHPPRAYTAPVGFNEDPRPPLPPPPPSTKLTTCGECGAAIEGSVFMLNDRGYCCQRHRLAAYHKSERARMRMGPVDAAASAEKPPEPVGLLARYPTWC